MKLAIGGDICPHRQNEEIFSSGKILKETISVFDEYDWFIANLECPLIEASAPVKKSGPVLGASVGCAKGLRSMGVNVLGVANNHIMDHGSSGLKTTLAALASNGIKAVGAGANLDEANKPLFLESDDSRVAVLAFAENEFSIAGENSSGAALFDSNNVIRCLRKLPTDVFKIILVHGGNEYCVVPNPWLRDTCHLMVELGADVVICQHSHCIGAYEKYLDAHIFYGQGNFIFDMPEADKYWNESLLISLEVMSNKLTKVQWEPVIQEPGSQLFRFAGDKEIRDILKRFKSCQDLIASDDDYAEAWKSFCEAKRLDYENCVFGYGKFLRRLNKLIRFTGFKGKQGRLNAGNVIRCPSHNEALKRLFFKD